MATARQSHHGVTRGEGFLANYAVIAGVAVRRVADVIVHQFKAAVVNLPSGVPSSVEAADDCRSMDRFD